MPNKIIYRFSPRRPLDLFSTLPLPNTYIAWNNIANAISFTFINQKADYNRKHQPFFIKVGDLAMLRIYKGYFIPSSARITKKLTQ